MYIFQYRCFIHSRRVCVNVSFIMDHRFRCFATHAGTHVHLEPPHTCRSAYRLPHWVFTVLFFGWHERITQVMTVCENYRTRRNGHMLPLTFQSVSLSKHVNFHSVLLSDPALSGSYFDFCPSPCSNTCRWARLAVPSTQRTTFCVVRGLVPRVTTACMSSPRDWAVSRGS